MRAECALSAFSWRSDVQVRKDGLKGLYRGIVPNLLKAVPSISISYVVFENTKVALTLRGWSRLAPDYER